MTQLSAMNTAIASTGAAGTAAAGGLGLMSVALLGIGVVALGAVAAIAGVATAFVGLGAVGLGISRSVESAMAGVLKTTTDLTDEFGRMNEAGEAVRQEFRELALIKPLPLEELLGIGALAGQLGIADEAIAGFSAVAADLIATTDLTIEEATLGLARLSGIFGVSAENMVQNAEQLGSTIVFLGNNFRATEPEILTFTKRLLAIGKAVGFTQADILGIGAAAASAGIETQLGATAIQTTFVEITKAVATGSDELEIFAETAGQSAEDFARQWRTEPREAFLDFIEGLGDAGEAAFAILEEVGLSSERKTRALIPLAATADELRRAMEEASVAFEENTARTREAEIRYGTFDSQMLLLKNRIRDTGLTIGDMVKDALLPLLETAGPLIDAIGEGLVPAFESVFNAVKDELLPALGELFIAFGFDIIKADLTQGIANFGETIAGGVKAFSDFVLDVVKLVDLFQEGGLVSVLELFGIKENTAQTIIDVASALGIAALAFTALNIAIGIFNTGAAIAAVLIGAFTSPIIVLSLLIGVLVIFGKRASETARILLTIFGVLLIKGGEALLMLLALIPAIFVRIFFEAREAAGTLVGIIAAGFFLMIPKAWEAFLMLIALVPAAFTRIFLLAREAAGTLVGIIAAMFFLIITRAGEEWENFKIVAERVWDLIVVGFLLFLLDILFAIRNAAESFVQAGRDLMSGFWDGLKSLAQDILNWLNEFANLAIGAVTGVFQSDSPSKVFKEIGKSLMEGLALGIAENMNLPQIALDAAGANIMNAGQGVISGAAAMGATSVDRSFNIGGMTVNAREQAPNRIVDDLALLAQLA